VSTVAVKLSPGEALRMIAGAPGAEGKTPADLRETAEDCERMADRKDRVVVGRMSNRRKARLLAAERDGDELRMHARVIRLAADECDRRKAPTVGEAVRPRFVRLLRRLSGRARG
jgi:hypothetical protein